MINSCNKEGSCLDTNGNDAFDELVDCCNDRTNQCADEDALAIVDAGCVSYCLLFVVIVLILDCQITHYSFFIVYHYHNSPMHPVKCHLILHQRVLLLQLPSKRFKHVVMLHLLERDLLIVIVALLEAITVAKLVLKHVGMIPVAMVAYVVPLDLMHVENLNRMAQSLLALQAKVNKETSIIHIILVWCFCVVHESFWSYHLHEPFPFFSLSR